MSKHERLQSECPPDAHKVYRAPENKLVATLAVKVEDQELETFGGADLCEVLSLMSQEPLILCSDKVKEAIISNAEHAEIKPKFLKINNDKASINYTDGSISEVRDLIDLSDSKADFTNYLEYLSQKCFIVVNTLGMLILRSISTVYPWDKLLAGDFVRQYIRARDILSLEDIENLMKIRYGLIDPFSVSETNGYKFLRLERKLFLQYPTDD